MPNRKIEKLVDAFSLIDVTPNQRIKDLVKKLQQEGRSEKSMCFAIWKSQDKLRDFRNDTRFYSILENEIKKWAWSRDDPRWTEYNKRKAEEKRVREEQDKQEKIAREFKKYKEKYPGFVYFIQGDSGGPIKIGYTEDVCKRLKVLQTGHFDTLIVLASFPASMKEEKNLHKKFSELQLKGEWFKPDRYLMDFIEPLKVKNPIVKHMESLKSQLKTNVI